MDNIYSLWDISNPDIAALFEQAKLTFPYHQIHHAPKFTETKFLDTVVYKGQDSTKAILDVKTHFKQTKEKP